MTKQQEIKQLVRELFILLDWEEESENGKEYHTTYIHSCRVAHGIEINRILPRLKELVK